MSIPTDLEDYMYESVGGRSRIAWLELIAPLSDPDRPPYHNPDALRQFEQAVSDEDKS